MRCDIDDCWHAAAAAAPAAMPAITACLPRRIDDDDFRRRRYSFYEAFEYARASFLSADIFYLG